LKSERNTRKYITNAVMTNTEKESISLPIYSKTEIIITAIISDIVSFVLLPVVLNVFFAYIKTAKTDNIETAITDNNLIINLLHISDIRP
jgi:hypothetical protein